jgi:iron complex transport system substrate-binding protein
VLNALRRFRRTWGLAALVAAGLAFSCRPVSPGDSGTAVPRRIVTWAPNLTEAVDALGLTDRLVATDDFSLHTPAIAALPKLGGLFNPNLERLAALRPDLVIVLPSSHDVARQAEALRIPVLVVRSETLDDVEGGLRSIGERCGAAARGAEVAAALHTELSPRNVARGRRVLLIAGRSPGKLSELAVAASGTFLSELVERLGAVNVFADAPTRWPQVGLEEIVARRPDVIIELNPEPLDDARRAAIAAEWNVLAIDAVRQGHVHVIAGDFTLVPGPRLGQLMREIERVLAPAPATPSNG